jgi:hypothetical protein
MIVHKEAVVPTVWREVWGHALSKVSSSYRTWNNVTNVQCLLFLWNIPCTGIPTAHEKHQTFNICLRSWTCSLYLSPRNSYSISQQWYYQVGGWRKQPRK